MANPYLTTPHGSLPAASISEVFICRECSSDVALVNLPGGDLAYECISPRCGHTASLDCPEALGVRDELAIELPAPFGLVIDFALARELVEVSHADR